ncbi:DUF6105 family protein [Hoeflea sp. CAU 1731]
MKWFLILWFVPVSLISAWYGLSYYDLNFGVFMLTRDVHDLVFKIYGDLLGIPPTDIPPLLLRALIVDSMIVMAIVAFRYRKKIIAWFRARRAAWADQSREAEESLSSAP